MRGVTRCGPTNIMLAGLSALIAIGVCSLVDTFSIEDTLRSLGYPCESHLIVTDDGYVLTVHRIPHGKGDNSTGGGHPAMLAHGLWQSADSWVNPSSPFALVFADYGLDVWLVNYRGNVYSRKHLWLDPEEKEFWNYTITEMGAGDLPPIIDYILTITGYPQVAYLGASLGGTVFWVLGAIRPEYMAKISLMVAIGPSGIISGDSSSHILTIMKIYGHTQKSMGVYELSVPLGLLRRLFSFCRSSLTGWVCDLILGSSLEEIMSNELKMAPSSISMNVMQQLGDISRTHRFQMFDYGETGNMEMYNSTIPPEYNLKNVNCTWYIICSESDVLSPPEEMEWMKDRFGTPPVRILDSDIINSFSHVDLFSNENLTDVLIIPLCEFITTKLNNH